MLWQILKTQINKKLIAQSSENGVSWRAKAYFTGREIEVLRGITKGKTSKEIGEELHITEETTNVHRKSMLKKTNSGGIADAIRFALRNGIVSIKEFLEKG